MAKLSVWPGGIRKSADALDAAISGYVADVMRQAAPVPQIPDTPGPIVREQSRPTQRQITQPTLGGLLPGAALDDKAQPWGLGHRRRAGLPGRGDQP